MDAVWEDDVWGYVRIDRRNTHKGLASYTLPLMVRFVRSRRLANAGMTSGLSTPGVVRVKWKTRSQRVSNVMRSVVAVAGQSDPERSSES